MWLDWPNDGAENGSEELVLVTGLNKESCAAPLNINCGCIEVDKLEGLWGPYDAPLCELRISIPLRSKYMWLSSDMGCGVETVEGKVELEGE
jgi:hypothetical protein